MKMKFSVNSFTEPDREIFSKVRVRCFSVAAKIKEKTMSSYLGLPTQA
jgi:hypothetical protein